ncbi:hypothetical protein Gpo141_00011029 [Globisporangium polare]
MAPQTITVGTIMEIGATQFIDTTAAKAALVCTATQRADIQTIKLLEANGNIVNAVVKYQKDTSNLAVVKNVTGVSCYESAAATDVSFAAKAATNYDYTNAIVAVECAASNAGDCMVKYEIAANCVAKSAGPTTAPATTVPTPTTATPTPTPTTTTKSTALANSGAGVMEYYTRVIAMVVSIAAGGFMMYMRH